MINENLVMEILSQYRKHGWNLCRVLLLPDAIAQLSESIERLFGETKISESRVNALWFSRSSAKNLVVWELRHLSENPFALCESFENDIDPDDLQEILGEMETRLKEKTSKPGH